MSDFRKPQGRQVEYGQGPERILYGKEEAGGILTYAGAIVNPDNPLAADDLLLTTPFLTVQGAINALPLGGTVLIAPGTYEESLQVLDDAVHLVALGPVVISPTSGPALIISNATQASLNLFLAGGPANYYTNRATLVSDGDGPQSNRFIGLTFAPQSAIDYGVVIAGAGDGTPFAETIGLQFDECQFTPTSVDTAAWMWLANRITVKDSEINGEVVSRNIASLLFVNCGQEQTETSLAYFDWSNYYDTGEDEPDLGALAKEARHCYFQNVETFVGASTWIKNSVIRGVARSNDSSSILIWETAIHGNAATHAVNALDTSSIYTYTCFVDGDLETDGTADWEGNGDFLSSNCDMTFGSGAGSAVMNGGGYMDAAVVDPDVKFVRNAAS